MCDPEYAELTAAIRAWLREHEFENVSNGFSLEANLDSLEILALINFMEGQLDRPGLIHDVGIADLESIPKFVHYIAVRLHANEESQDGQ